MNQKHAIFTYSLIAVGAISEYRAIGFDGAQATVAGAKVAGVATTDAVAGEPVAVDMIGTTVVETGGAFSAGDDLVVDAEGRAIVNPAVGGEYIFADALEDAGAAGEFVEVALRR
jgi:hypothetical protein